MLLRDAMAEFLNSRQAAGKRPKTLRFYSDNISSYLSYLEENCENGTAWLGPKTIESFLNFERERGLADTSIWARFRALRAFFNWLVKRGYLESSPIDDVEEPTPTVKPPKRINLDAFQQLLSSIPTQPATWMNCRDRLLIEMLFWTGIRLGELVGIRLEDVDLGRRLLRINEAKGRRSRFVPFPQSMVPTFQRYLLTQAADRDHALCMFLLAASYRSSGRSAARAWREC